MLDGVAGVEDGDGGAVVEPAPPLTYWLYEDEWAMLRSIPKKLK